MDYLETITKDIRDRSESISRDFSTIITTYSDHQDKLNAYLIIKLAELELKNEELGKQNEIFTNRINQLCERNNLYEL